MSSTRKFLPAFTVISNGDMSSNITSLVTNIAYLDQISIQITSINVNAVGQWSIEGSVDNSTYIPITLDPPISATTSGVNDHIMIDMKLLSFTYIRVIYTATSGAGSATVKVSGKGN